MNTSVKFLAAVVLLISLNFAALSIANNMVKQDPFQLIYKEGPRTWDLDTRSIVAKTEEESGIEYLDFQVRVSYAFTTDIDYLQYMAARHSRQWQPVSATGCDKDGNVLEL